METPTKRKLSVDDVSYSRSTKTEPKHNDIELHESEKTVFKEENTDAKVIFQSVNCDKLQQKSEEYLECIENGVSDVTIINQKYIKQENAEDEMTVHVDPLEYLCKEENVSVEVESEFVNCGVLKSENEIIQEKLIKQERAEQNTDVDQFLKCKEEELQNSVNAQFPTYYKCDQCGIICAEIFSLTEHLRTHEEIKHQCKVCNRTFIQNSHLTEHMRIHTGDKPFKCDICNRRFIQHSHLTQHLRTHTGLKPYECKTCDKQFTRKSSLAAHLQLHAGIKQFKCEVCDATFTRNTHLTQHFRIHSGERPFNCETCGKKFTRKDSLNVHIRIHAGIKQYKCNMCDRMFTRNQHLTQHLRVHSGEKPFGCQTCDKRFADASNLAQHTRIHRRDKLIK